MIVRVFIEGRGKMHRFPFNSNLFQFFLGVERVASGEWRVAVGGRVDKMVGNF